MTINNKAKAEKLTKNHTVDSIDLLNIINSLMAIYLQTQDGGQAKRFYLED